MSIVQLDDTHLFYVELGGGHPCLVMHGGPGSDHMHVRPWLDALGGTFQLIYYDHRGNGRSGRPPLETHTYEQFAADADALREHLGHDQVAVIGFSAGGAIALHYALAYPERLSHLMLVGTHTAWDYGEEVAENLAQRQATPEQLAPFSAPPPTTDAEFAAMVETITPLYYHRFDPEANRLFLKDVIRTASTYLRYVELMPTHNVVPRLGEIQAPTLVLVGRDDFITPPSRAERIQRASRTPSW